MVRQVPVVLQKSVREWAAPIPAEIKCFHAGASSLVISNEDTLPIINLCEILEWSWILCVFRLRSDNSFFSLNFTVRTAQTNNSHSLIDITDSHSTTGTSRLVVFTGSTNHGERTITKDTPDYGNEQNLVWVGGELVVCAYSIPLSLVLQYPPSLWGTQWHPGDQRSVGWTYLLASLSRRTGFALRSSFSWRPPVALSRISSKIDYIELVTLILTMLTSRV